MREKNEQIVMKFGQILRNARESKGYSQTEVAEKATITTAYYSYIELGKRNVSLVLAIKLCLILGIKPEDAFQDIAD